ncbi:MAG: YlqD family protein [Vampirovibrio sp.]|nr:YlqD family protein [Vampirovibrio sp.]
MSDNNSLTYDSIQLKRQVNIKSKVTPQFKEQATGELSREVKLIESQLEMLESQYQHTLKQLEEMAGQGQGVKKQLDQLNQEAQGKRNQLSSLKMEVSRQLANLDKVEDGNYVITGMLESFVTLKVGDNIYQKIQNTEILVENGIITDIRGGVAGGDAPQNQ